MILYLAKRQRQNLDQYIVDDCRSKQRHAWFKSCTLDKIACLLDIQQPYITDDSSLLDQHDKLVAQRRKNILHRLRDHNPRHRLECIKSQRSARLALSVIHGKNTAPDDLRYIGALIDTERNGRNDPLVQIDRRKDDKVDHHQLGNGRRTANHVRINPTDGL